MRLACTRLSALLAVALAAAAVGVSAASADGGSITYQATPFWQFAFGAPAAPAAFPAPSECVAAFGLACYTPQLIRTAYDVPSRLNGAGQSIVIVDAYGSPTIRRDLATFDAEFGLPDPTLNIIYPGGSPVFNPLQHHAEANWAFETSLDVEWAHAIAPKATINLVIAANNGGNVLNDAQRYAIDHHLGNVMSLSFGAPEGAINGGGNNLQVQQAHAGYVAAKAAGMTVFASTGDSGASNGYPFANAGYPASDSLVTAVGGTNLFISDTGAYQSEDVWNDADASLCPFGCLDGIFGATGGAPSVVSGKQGADVSYNAGVYTGVLTFISFPGVDPGFYFTGGTSAGAPQWAAIVALADQAAGKPLGYLNDDLAAIAANRRAVKADFHDVTVGNNAFFGPGFSAGAGIDRPTGLGSPDAATLIASLTH
jgi:subtilase family serine protease